MRPNKYILLSNDTGERLVLKDGPINWDAIRQSLLFDSVYFGLLKTVSAQLEFVGDGYTFLKDHYIRYGIDADVVFRVYKGHDFYGEGKVSFEGFVIEEKTKKFICDLVDSSFVQKIQNRDEVNINILSNQNLDGFAIDPILTKDALIRGKELKFLSEFDGRAASDQTIRWGIVPFTMVKNDNPNVKAAFGADENINNIISPAFAHYFNQDPISQTFDFSFDVNLVFTATGGSSIELRLFHMDNDDEVVGILSQRTLGNITGLISWGDSFNNFVLPSGHYLIFAVGILGTNRNVSYQSLSLTFDELSLFPDTTNQVVLPHELFSYLVEAITGKKNAFKSKWFGRVDLGYDEDGPFAYLSACTGKIIRGFDLDTLEFATSFRDAFDSYNSICNLGVIIKNGKVIIEPKELLRNAEIIIDLGQVSNLRISPADEFYFNRVIAGYPTPEYEELNGIDEFNTTTEFTNNLISTKNELNIISRYRADGMGIEQVRRKDSIRFGTQDTRYDNDIFLIDLVKVGNGLISRRLEGITFVDNIISPGTAFNLRISPAQNLRRWLSYLSIPVAKNERTYRYQSKDFNSRAIIQVGNTITIENQDIEANVSPFFQAEFKEFEAPITFGIIKSIQSNPYGLIKYQYGNDRFYDYIYEIDAETESNSVVWKVISARSLPVREKDADLAQLPIVKYDNGINDFVKYNQGPEDYILYE